jgi:hypothetical protein
MRRRAAFAASTVIDFDAKGAHSSVDRNASSPLLRRVVFISEAASGPPRLDEGAAGVPQSGNHREAVMSEKTGVTTDDLPRAPIIYFDATATFATAHGIVGVSLAAHTSLPTGGNMPVSQPVLVAHLRCSLAAATDLRDTLNRVLLLAAKHEGGTQ